MENHVLNIDNREKLTVTEVADVDSFNEETILITLKNGGLVIKGLKLHIQKLDLAEGKVIITGSINSAVYTQKKDKNEKSLLRRIFE
ncbi:MAG: sporulation protein YabP [Aminipila sp.]